MRKYWIIILIVFLIAFDALLAMTYLQKKAGIEKSYQLIKAGAKLSENTFYGPWNSRRSLKYAQPVSCEKFARQALEFDTLIGRLLTSGSSRPAEYFRTGAGIRRDLQDSLWRSYEGYRLSLEQTLDNLLPERHGDWALYQRISELSREARTADPAKRKALQDTLSALKHHRYPLKIQLNDSATIGRVLHWLHKTSNPVDEFSLKESINKMGDLLPARGKVSMHGKIYSLGELSPAQQDTFYNEIVLLKLEIDERFCFVAQL